MYLQAIRIDHFGVTAYGRKIKSAFSFLDEVLHFASAAVKLNHLIRFHLHCRDDEGEQVYHLSIRLLNLKHNHLDFCTYEFEEYIGLLPLISSNP